MKGMPFALLENMTWPYTYMFGKLYVHVYIGNNILQRKTCHQDSFINYHVKSIDHQLRMYILAVAARWGYVLRCLMMKMNIAFVSYTILFFYIRKNDSSLQKIGT